MAEEQCTALGVRLPRFGIIEASEPNAVTVGEGPNRGLIAVTRGLLDRLDDDELAAVLAHEASHIRHGDTKLLAANHALMRTAVILQMNNPLRFENWRQMIIPLIFPPMMLVMLAGSAATAMSMQLVARGAARAETGPRLHRRRRGHPRHAFPRGPDQRDREDRRPRRVRRQLSRRGPCCSTGSPITKRAAIPPSRDRIDAIGELGGELMNPARLRRDTRGAAAPPCSAGAREWLRPPIRAMPQGRPLEQPQPPSKDLLLLYFTDRETFRQWHDAAIAWTEWELRERRNVLGLTYPS